MNENSLKINTRKKAELLSSIDFSALTSERAHELVGKIETCFKQKLKTQVAIADCVYLELKKYIPESIFEEWISRTLIYSLYQCAKARNRSDYNLKSTADNRRNVMAKRWNMTAEKKDSIYTDLATYEMLKQCNNDLLQQGLSEMIEKIKLDKENFAQYLLDNMPTINPKTRKGVRVKFEILQSVKLIAKANGISPQKCFQWIVRNVIK